MGVKIPFSHSLSDQEPIWSAWNQLMVRSGGGEKCQKSLCLLSAGLNRSKRKRRKLCCVACCAFAFNYARVLQKVHLLAPNGSRDCVLIPGIATVHRCMLNLPFFVLPTRFACAYLTHWRGVKSVFLGPSNQSLLHVSSRRGGGVPLPSSKEQFIGIIIITFLALLACSAHMLNMTPALLHAPALGQGYVEVAVIAVHATDAVVVHVLAVVAVAVGLAVAILLLLRQPPMS